jgi:hypothetical protein
MIAAGLIRFVIEITAAPGVPAVPDEVQPTHVFAGKVECERVRAVMDTWVDLHYPRLRGKWTSACKALGEDD